MTAAGAATESRNRWLLFAGLGAVAVVVVGVIAGALVPRVRGWRPANPGDRSG